MRQLLFQRFGTTLLTAGLAAVLSGFLIFWAAPATANHGTPEGYCKIGGSDTDIPHCSILAPSWPYDFTNLGPASGPCCVRGSCQTQYGVWTGTIYSNYYLWVRWDWPSSYQYCWTNPYNPTSSCCGTFYAY